MIIRIFRLASPFILLICISATARNDGLSAPSGSLFFAQNQNRVEEKNDQWTWRWRENGIGLELTINGKAEFNDDYTDLISISPGGSLHIKDERGGRVRRLEIVPTSGGLKRSYYIDNQQQAYDDEAAKWFADVLMEAVRRGGLDAQKRAQRFLKQRGALALLDEISELKGDFVKRVYLEELIKGGGLNAEIARRILAKTAREISSDYEKAQILTIVAEGFLTDDDVRSAYMETVDTIRSDYEKRRALSALLKDRDLRKETLLLVIKSASVMRSDYEKASVLISVTEKFLEDTDVRNAYLEAASTIRSDYEKARTLSALLKKADLGKDTLLLAIKSAARISSDYEKAGVLIRAAEVNSGDEAIRGALIDTAKTIRSEYERGRVLNAVFSK